LFFSWFFSVCAFFQNLLPPAAPAPKTDSSTTASSEDSEVRTWLRAVRGVIGVGVGLVGLFQSISAPKK
jgi:hypothetical protein